MFPQSFQQVDSCSSSVPIILARLIISVCKLGWYNCCDVDGTVDHHASCSRYFTSRISVDHVYVGGVTHSCGSHNYAFLTHTSQHVMPSCVNRNEITPCSYMIIIHTLHRKYYAMCIPDILQVDSEKTWLHETQMMMNFTTFCKRNLSCYFI